MKRGIVRGIQLLQLLRRIRLSQVLALGVRDVGVGIGDSGIVFEDALVVPAGSDLVRGGST